MRRSPVSWRGRSRGAAPGAALLAFGLWACGGDKGTLTVKIVTPPGADDPFVSATQVRMSVGSNNSSADVSAGHFSVKIEIDSPSKDEYVRLSVEALDAAGTVVGRGLTPNFVLLPQNSEISVFVGRPGRVAPTEEHLQNDGGQAAGRADLSGASLRGRLVMPAPERAIGVLVTGGTDESGAVQGSSLLYDPLTHKIVAAGKPAVPRRGAALVPTADGDQGQQAILWGGAPIAAGVEGDLPTTAEIFDPNMSSLATVFQGAQMDVAEAGAPGAVGPTTAEIKDGIFLSSGGRDRRVPPGNADTPLNQAVLLQRFPAPEGSDNKMARPGVRRLPPMAAARYGHTATLVALTEGAGLLLFGGVADGQPVAEVFSLPRVEFRALTLMDGSGMAVPARRGHAAAPLQDGRVLIIGGVTTATGVSVVEDSGLLVDPVSGQVVLRPGLLSVPRHSAAATLMGDEIVVCGGVGADGRVLASCEYIGSAGAMRARESLPMPTARAGHRQLLLETGQLLLVGGFGDGGHLPSVVDLYTPLR